MADRVRLGALWQKQGQKGTFFSGALDKEITVQRDGVETPRDIIVFQNGYKEGNEKAPDFIIYLQDRQPQGQGAPQKPKFQPGPAKADIPADDEIPF